MKRIGLLLLLAVPMLMVLIAAWQGIGSFLGNYFIAKVSLSLVHDLRIPLHLVAANHGKQDVVDQRQGIKLPGLYRRLLDQILGPVASLIDLLRKNPRAAGIGQNHLPVI